MTGGWFCAKTELLSNITAAAKVEIKRGFN